MSDLLLQTHQLTKKYHEKIAIEDISISVEAGKIYGFIGENGAGKTTTIRILTGLSKATSGSIEIFGKKSKVELEKARKKIGCLVEHPILSLSQTAKENLKMQSLLYGKSKESNIDSLLERVGLSEVADKKVKDFSLGMKQRLGIALTLIQEPKLLILDEPTNGLDPMGMVDVRNLLLSLNKKDGITILISSHILTELYRLVSDYIIISHGRIVEQVSGQELDRKCSKRIIIESDQIDRVVRLLQEKLHIQNFEIEGNQMHLFEQTENIRMIAKLIFDARIMITKLTSDGITLEEYYMELLRR